jgi:hypothetical protein
VTLLLLLAAARAGPHADQWTEFGARGPQRWDLPPAAAAPAPAAPPDRPTVYGYWPYWSPDPTELDFDRLTHLAIFNVDLESDGTLSSTATWTSVAPAVVPLAHAHGVRVHVCVTAFSSSVHTDVLSDAGRRATTIAQLASLVEAYGADGVNVDFEGLSSTNRDRFTTFIRELSAAVEDVYIATPAVDWSDAFDYDALAASSEGLFIMGYGYHWTGGDPGPNDPLYGGGAWATWSLDWSVGDNLANGAPADKIIVGLPLYGQEWPAGREVPGHASGDGWPVTMAEAVPIAAAEGRAFDDTTLSPYVLRASTQLWYDDHESVRARIRWARAAGVQGVGFWALGYESDPAAFWDMVATETAPSGGEDTDAGTDTAGGTDSGGDGPTDGADTGGGGSHRADVIRGGRGCAAAPAPLWLGVVALLLIGRAGRR